MEESDKLSVCFVPGPETWDHIPEVTWYKLGLTQVMLTPVCLLFFMPFFMLFPPFCLLWGLVPLPGEGPCYCAHGCTCPRTLPLALAWRPG